MLRVPTVSVSQRRPKGLEFNKDLVVLSLAALDRLATITALLGDPDREHDGMSVDFVGNLMSLLTRVTRSNAVRPERLQLVMRDLNSLYLEPRIANLGGAALVEANDVSEALNLSVSAVADAIRSEAKAATSGTGLTIERKAWLGASLPVRF